MSSRVQMYLEKHKITSLFEELMNKVIRDSPDNPIIYLIKQLYRKAGLSIPLELKSNMSLSKTTPDLTIRGQSTEIVSKSTLLTSWAKKSDEFRAVSAPVSKDKSYVRPSQQKEKPKASLHPKKPMEANSMDFTEAVKLKTPQDHKEKPGWNGDTKIKSASFNDYSADRKANGSKSAQIQDSRKSWAMIGLNDTAVDSFQDGCYTGPKVTHRIKIKDDDILSEETVMSSRHKYYKEESATKPPMYTGRISNKQAIAENHKKNLEKILKENGNRATMSSKAAIGSGYEDADSAVELLENPADLISEGVHKLPPVGYKLSKTLRHREEDAQVKLNINLYSGAAPSEIGSAISQFDDFSEYDQESVGRQTTAANQLVRFDDSDDDFDSASQVASSTQKMPNWKSKHFDGETYSLGRTPSPQPPLQENHTFLSKSVTIQEPIRAHSPITSRLRSSAPPLSNSIPALRTSTNSDNFSINSSLPLQEQDVTNSQNLVDLKTESYGWEFSDDSDGSIVSAHSTHQKAKKLPRDRNQ